VRMALNFNDKLLMILSAIKADTLSPFCVVSGTCMIFCNMFPHSNDFKIVNSVVQFVSIFVVDMFSAFQRSANVFSHNDTVFKVISSVDADGNISIRANKPSAVSVLFFAVKRAVFSTLFNSTWFDIKLFSTISTSDCNRHVITSCICANIFIAE